MAIMSTPSVPATTSASPWTDAVPPAIATDGAANSRRTVRRRAWRMTRQRTLSSAARRAVRVRAVGLDDREGVAGRDRDALLDRELGDHARLVGGDLVLHLHRLDDGDELALLDLLARLD